MPAPATSSIPGGYGSIAVDDSISLETTFLEGFGELGAIPPSQYREEVKNTVGLNTTFL